MTFFGLALMRNYKTLHICIYGGFLMALAMGLNSAEAAAPKVYSIEIMEMAGRPGHQGLFPTQSQPVIGAKAIVEAAMVDGLADQVNLVMRDAAGNLLSKTPMLVSPQEPVGSHYLADIVIPDVPFTMSINGIDKTGNAFEGLPQKPSSYTPQTFDIVIIPTISDILPDFPLYFSVRVTNLGALDTFNVSLSSDVGGTMEPLRKEIKLDQGQSADVQFLYTAPSNIIGKYKINPVFFTATASSITDKNAVNQATVKLYSSPQETNKLIVWLNKGEQGMLGRSRQAPLIVWMCNDQINNYSISLNMTMPSEIKVIPIDSPDADSSPQRGLCMSTSVLRLKFNASNLFEALQETIGIPSESRVTQVPLMARSADDMTDLIGYVPLVLGKKIK